MYALYRCDRAGHGLLVILHPIVAFPDGNSALMLAAARLRHIAGTQWGSKRYLSMELLRDLDAPETHAA
jgi:hypothetical protein